MVFALKTPPPHVTARIHVELRVSTLNNCIHAGKNETLQIQDDPMHSPLKSTDTMSAEYAERSFL